MWGGYRIGVRLLGYEVTARPAGNEGEGVCVDGSYGKSGVGGCLPSLFGFVCQWHESGSGH